MRVTISIQVQGRVPAYITDVRISVLVHGYRCILALFRLTGNSDSHPFLKLRLNRYLTDLVLLQPVVA
jgi:hypothetical protein